MDGKTTREGVVDGESINVRRLPVASSLVNVPTHVEVEGVATRFSLLAHVLQLNIGQMH